MWVQHLSSLQFLSYVAFFAVVLIALMRLMPGAKAPVRAEPYPADELGSEDAKLGKYFVAGGIFLVVGGIHMAVKTCRGLRSGLPAEAMRATSSATSRTPT
jgi:hypothetical protein